MLSAKINDIISGLITYSGHAIGNKIANARSSYEEIEQGLKILCNKRGCDVERASAGDTAPIQVLRQSRDEAFALLSNENEVKYVRLDELIGALENSRLK